MQTHDLDGLSWVATPGSLDALPPSLVSGASTRPMALEQRTVRAACFRNDPRVCFAAVDGWTYAFGFQLGLGGRAGELSKARGVALSFENNGKRGIRLCSVYRDGELVRQVSDIDGQFSQEGSPLPGEPSVIDALDDATVVALARAWGADVSRVEWGAAGVLASSPTSRGVWPIALVVILLALLVLAVPSKAERCRARCERSWKATYRNTPECRGVALDQCQSLRQAVEACVADCR